MGIRIAEFKVFLISLRSLDPGSSPNPPLKSEPEVSHFCILLFPFIEDDTLQKQIWIF
jgi:hypothetical protein